MRFKNKFVAIILAGIVINGNHALAEDQGKPIPATGSQRYCLYQDQKYSEGWVQKGMVCTRGRISPVVNGSRDETRLAFFMWVPQEKPALANPHQELEETLVEIQLIQARTALMEAEARHNDAVLKLKRSDKK